MEKKETLSPQWKMLYEAAMLELDPVKILRRIADAERAIMERMEGLDGSRSDGVENQELASAHRVLRDLRKMVREADQD